MRCMWTLAIFANLHNLGISHFYRIIKSDINCGAFSQADFILKYFLSNFLKLSISSQPGWQAGWYFSTKCEFQILIMTMGNYQNNRFSQFIYFSELVGFIPPHLQTWRPILNFFNLPALKFKLIQQSLTLFGGIE